MTARDSVEQAIYQLASSYPHGGIAGLARDLGRKNQTTFFNQMSFQGDGNHQPTIGTLRAAMRMTGDLGPLYALAAEFGQACVQLGDYRDCSDTELLGLITSVGAARGEVDQEIHRAFADGRIERGEGAAIRRKVEAEIRANLELLSRIDALERAETEAVERRLRAVPGRRG